jgi:hypothetical protein
MQNHFEFVYCNVHPLPMVPNVIVPVPLAFQPALVTVITMFPEAMATALNTLICPVVPAARVAVSAAAVVK